MTLTREQAVIVALGAGEAGAFSPVQVQKLFFLLDENASDALGGKMFNFEPYDYGPFDKDVYRELENLNASGLVDIQNIEGRGGRRFSLNAAGMERARELIDDLDDELVDYMKRISNWVRELDFAQLVGAIYKKYPHMKENSIFQN